MVEHVATVLKYILLLAKKIMKEKVWFSRVVFSRPWSKYVPVYHDHFYFHRDKSLCCINNKHHDKMRNIFVV